MEDSSLDDFFAKKDKSKKKSKVKSVEKDDGSKSTKKEKRKDKPTKIASQNSSSNKTQERKPDDDEWNDFEEERAVDYSGLRIQNLQQKEEPEKDIEDDEEELDENGDVKERRDKRESQAGPWNKSGSVAPPVAVGLQQEEEKKPAPSPASTGKYIPPSQRAAMAAAARGGPAPGSGKRGKKELPNIRSDVDFPTLSAMSLSDSPASHQSNQSSHSQGGSSSIHDTTTHHRAGGVLTLENKFAVLQD